MRPFQRFRLWARRAPVGERGVAAAAAMVVFVGLVTLAAVPSGEDDDTVAAGGSTAATSEPGLLGTGAATSAEAAVPAGDAVAGTAPGAAAPNRAAGGGRPVAGGSGGGAAGVTTPGGCVSPPGTDQGITDKEVKIALMLVELVGATGNETVNVPSKEAQKADYDAMVDEINKTGGVACRKLTPLYFTINPLDQAQLQQTCLDVAEAKVFYANDLGGYAAFPGVADCYIQHQIPFYEGNFIPQQQLERAYPYMFAAGTQDNVYFNAAFALKEMGFFDPAKGFKKLGYFYQDCIPEHPKKYLNWLERAGVRSSDIVTYNFGCPVGLYAPPSDIAAAVLQFQRQGVTHVTHVRGEGDWYNFTRAAQQQGYKPKYGWGDQSASFSSYGTLSPDWRNADGAILITDYRFNEERTPGLRPTSGTERCARIMAAHGQPHPYKQQIGMSGVACNQLWFFQSAINHAPELKRTALAQGLLRGGEIDFSYPHGPATFPTPKSTYHGNFWRPLVAHADCSCWLVADPNFRPTFPGFA